MTRSLPSPDNIGNHKFPYGLEYEAPDPGDIFPREYANDTQRRVLFLSTLNHFKRPRNWLGSQIRGGCLCLRALAR